MLGSILHLLFASSSKNLEQFCLPKILECPRSFGVSRATIQRNRISREDAKMRKVECG